MALHEIKEGESFSEWLLVELHRAYLETRKGKRHTEDEHVFEVNEIENLLNLRDTIINKTYKPGRGIAFVIKKPVIREIFAAPFRDRIVHRFLYNAIADWWDRRLIYDCYSCRKGKGTWFGIYRAEKNMRRASENFTKRAFVIKLDIERYFVSLPRKRLFERVVWGLDRQFPDRGKIYYLLKFLWERIIFDDPVKGVMRKGSPRDWRSLPRSKSLFFQPPGRGIVVGNLSSQLLSNIYLDSLDRFVTFELGYKEYGRYADDFYIMVSEEKIGQARKDINKIEQFLAGLGLKLHPKKRYVQSIEKGMPFLGAVVYPGRIVPGKRVKGNFRKGVRACSAGEKGEETVASYLGFMKNLDGKRLVREVFREVGWEYEW
ncbi:RNA-directed DNA polymerase [Candidatus Saccharibacteria bacterium]|nr:RNA-directed DNA polymerase [Candidatus Saccharibacteria bacterium]